MASITNDRVHTLQVPGARLAYEVRGSGPVLLMIPGGEGDGAGFGAVANALAGDYTVVTYDRRGAVRSTIDDLAKDVRLETHSDDAHYLLSRLTTEPAFVFGSSAGALIGLDLALRYPADVRLLVAHEPPVEGVLPAFDQFQNELFEIYRRQGGLAAMMKVMQQNKVSYADMEPGAELAARDPREMTARGAAFTYTLEAVHGYRLNLAALATTPVRVVLAAGGAGRDTLGYACTAAVAKRLGVAVVDFPSHHAGYVSHPRAFAGKLREVLQMPQG